jgi:hypothetical protein
VTTARARKRNVGGAVAVLLVGIASLIIGMHALLHVDNCGDQPMHAGDLCPSHSSRTGHAWINDANQQQARNHRVGVAMLAAGGGFVVASGLIYRFTSGESRGRGRERPR